jgi:glycosyltransferase involved in cell wall biosynthesis
MIRPYLERGGATQSLLNLASGLMRKGHRVSIAAAGGIWISKAKEAGLPIYQIPLAPSTPLHLLLSTRRLKKILQYQSIDLIHSHHRFAALAARIAAGRLNIPHVTTVHEYKTNRRHLTRLGTGDHIITFSNALKHHLIGHYQIPAEKISVVTMGANVGQFGKLSNRHALKRPSIGCIVRLSAEKGIAILLQSLVHIIQTTSHRPHCYIAGDGPALKRLISQAEKLKINKSVTFVGWQDNIEDLIVQCDFLVLPSLFEGFGLVVLEGWAQERPTIGSHVGGISELIQDNKTGILVPPNDPMALSEAVVRLLENPNLATEMGKRGRLETLPRFTVEAMVQETEHIYRRLIEQ